jgi:hypothetical protein
VCLNEHLFANLKEAREIIEGWKIDYNTNQGWKIDYNTNRWHTSLNGLTPTEFAPRPDEGQNWNRLSLNEGKLGSRSTGVRSERRAAMAKPISVQGGRGRCDVSTTGSWNHRKDRLQANGRSRHSLFAREPLTTAAKRH